MFVFGKHMISKSNAKNEGCKKVHSEASVADNFWPKPITLRNSWAKPSGNWVLLWYLATRMNSCDDGQVPVVGVNIAVRA